MDDFDFWRLCDELSIFNAALLMSGQNPSGENCHIEKWQIDERPRGYEAAKTFIISSLKKNKLEGDLCYLPDIDQQGRVLGWTDEINLNTSEINVKSLKALLREKDFHDGFFVSDESKDPEYLNMESPYHALKLAAAIKAWEAVTTDNCLMRNKTPKQALEKWLKEHANEFGLTDEEGDPIKGTIEQIAKVANWKPEGGAAKTPNLNEVSSNVTPLKKVQSKQNGVSDLDDEIPF